MCRRARSKFNNVSIENIRPTTRDYVGLITGLNSIYEHMQTSSYQADNNQFTTMASSPITTSTEPEQKNDKSMPAAMPPTSILHRTPWRPPVAVSGQGCYITLEDGRKVIDGVGGAAVACIGNGHPEPLKAIKEQVNKVSCEFMPSIVEHGNNVNWIYA
jgi:hypothetical protein